MLWGSGTEYARRFTNGERPWDTHCRVTPHIGGYEVMADMKQAFRAAIETVEATRVPSARGHVYLAGWRLNGARTLDEPSVSQDERNGGDETALGWLLRLMEAGIAIRVLLWLPSRLASETSFKAHAYEHLSVARKIARYSAERTLAGDPPLGVCLLDRRLPRIASSHHRKVVIIRAGDVHLGYCGGVDLAYTRKDSPSRSIPYSRERPQFLGGDPQSGNLLSTRAENSQPRPTRSDLPSLVYGDRDLYWHDQHFKLEGPAVASLESMFRDGWEDDYTGRAHVLDSTRSETMVRAFGFAAPLVDAEVIVTTSEALTPDRRRHRPFPQPAATRNSKTSDPRAGAQASVQLWRTVPVRQRGREPKRFAQGEFTVLSGVANAISNATELIWIFDQYFWSQPLAVQLRSQLLAHPELRALIVVPPYADAVARAAHHARQAAYKYVLGTEESSADLGERPRQLAAYALWHGSAQRGIYAHAKAHIYDGALLTIGSANCNARSFTGDTEIVAAVQHRRTIYDHMRRLWNTLLPASPWPWGSDLETADPLPIGTIGWGRVFFDAFTTAAKQPRNNVVPDALFAGGRLPNGTLPPQDRRLHWILENVLGVIEARGISSNVEASNGPDNHGIVPLLDIARRVEEDPTWRIAP